MNVFENTCKIFVVAATFATLSVSPASAHSCEEEIPLVQAQVDKIDVDDSAFGDKQIAEVQLQKAQKLLDANNESGCLRYLDAARSTVEAAQNVEDR